LRWEDPLGNQLAPETKPIGMVDPEHVHRHPANGAEPHQSGPAPAEMFRPSVAARIKERNDVIRNYVNHRDVWTFTTVASRADQGEIAQLRLPSVLASDDVIDFEWQWRECLREMAVLADSLCSIVDAPA
jgi:hypothetical protein